MIWPRARAARFSAFIFVSQLFWAAPAFAKTSTLAKKCTALSIVKSASSIDARVSTETDARANETSAFCQVNGKLRPVAGSDIGFQLWLPTQWNGRIIMFGNGGYSSALPLEQMAVYLRQGYAVVGTDTGHQGDDPGFAVGHPQAIDDWGWRAVHETAVSAKALVKRFYGRRARYSYFNGCSTGGHQALMEAQRFPSDFNGIVAGAPGSNRTRLNIGFLWQYMSNHRPDGSLILPAAKLRLLTAAALKGCGGDKAVAAGYLEKPFACRIALAKLACGQQDSESCLSPEEMVAARRMYEGARDPKTAEQIYPPWLPGSESTGPKGTPLPGWSLYWADPAKPAQPMRINFFRDWVFDDPSWHWGQFDFGDLRAFEPLSKRIDATDPNLRTFKTRGGKLIQFHGLADPVVSPWDSRNYYTSVVDRMGPATRDFYRLFFVPGMGHCGGGTGFNASGPQGAIEAWVERNEAPVSLHALSQNKIAFEIPPE